MNHTFNYSLYVGKMQPMSEKWQSILEAIRKETPPHEIAQQFRPLIAEDFFSLRKGLKKEIPAAKYPFFLSMACLMVDTSTVSAILDGRESSFIEELRETASKEAIGHLLFLYVHESERDLLDYQRSKGDILEEIESLTPLTLKEMTIDLLLEKFALAKRSLHLQENRVEQAIILAFHSQESAMADCFSQLRLLIQEELSFSFSAFLDIKLRAFFSTEEGVLLQDSDPATEGLILLGIAFAKDFWALGLLPDVTDPACLAQEDATRALALLSKMGLKKIDDLRREKLYSIPLLKRWIQKKLHTP
jgi:hypothetical protein